MSNNLCVRDHNNHLRFNIDALDKKQCVVASDVCKTEASSERYKVIAEITGSAIMAGVVIVTALTVANVAMPYFVALIAKTEALSGFAFHSAVYDVATLVFYGLTYTCGLLGLRAIFDGAVQKVKSHFDYAAELDNQALAASLRKAALDNQGA